MSTYTLTLQMPKAHADTGFLCRNYDEAIRVMQRAAFIPKNPKINYHDQAGPLFPALSQSFFTHGHISHCPHKPGCSNLSSFGPSTSISRNR